MMNENELNENLKEEISKDQSAHTHKKKHKTVSKNPDEKTEKEMVELSNKLDESERKLNEYHDKYLRLSAEFDNYRKRTIKERADLLRTAGEDCLIRILPVMDDLERAMKSMDSSADIEAVKNGVGLICSKLKDILSQQGIKEIDAVSKEFNTDLHEALSKVPATEEQLKGKVMEVVEKGYFLNDKVIRYAKVIVGE
jgi:molecular chaperone GrpE